MDCRGRQGLAAHAAIFRDLLSGLPALCGRRRRCPWWRRWFWRRHGHRIHPLQVPPRASALTSMVAATSPVWSLMAVPLQGQGPPPASKVGISVEGSTTVGNAVLAMSAVTAGIVWQTVTYSAVVADLPRRWRLRPRSGLLRWRKLPWTRLERLRLRRWRYGSCHRCPRWLWWRLWGRAKPSSVSGRHTLWRRGWVVSPGRSRLRRARGAWILDQ